MAGLSGTLVRKERNGNGSHGLYTIALLFYSTKDYLSTGNKRSVNIFDITQNFELDSPDAFLIDSDYSIKPLYPWTRIKINEFNSSRLFWTGPAEVQPDDEVKEGSLFYTWKFENGKWDKGTTMVGKVQMITKVISLPLAYLSPLEAEKVRKNPAVLKYYDKNRIPPNESINEIFNKAREKFISSTD